MSEENQEQSKLPLILIIAALLILVFLAAVYFFLFAGRNSTTSVEPEQTNPEEEKVSTTSATQKTDEDLITEALVAKTNISTDQIVVKVTQKTLDFAKGTVGTKGEETGGGYFLAAKVGNDWVIVYDGQATPTCLQLSDYDFPTSMVEECLNENGDVVKR